MATVHIQAFMPNTFEAFERFRLSYSRRRRRLAYVLSEWKELEEHSQLRATSAARRDGKF